MRKSSLVGGFALVFALSTAHAQNIRKSPVHDQSGPSQDFGRSVTGLGDWTGDGRSEYAVAAPSAGFGGYLSGRVVVYDGATGVPLPSRTYDGQGIISTATGCFGSAFNDRLGWVVTDIEDMDGDGKSELLMTRPFAASNYTTPCPSREHGGFRIAYSNLTTPPFQYTYPNPLSNMGGGAARLDNDNGRPTFAVSSIQAGVQVWQQLTPGSPPALVATIPVPSMSSWQICAAGTTANGTPRFAVFTQLNGLTVYTIQGFAVQSYPAPAALGFSLARIGTAASSALVIGVNSLSAVIIQDLNGGGSIQVNSPPTSPFPNILGSVATGGDVDGDGDEDFVALFDNGKQIFVGDRSGNTAARSIQLPPPSPGNPLAGAVDIIGDVNGDGFADVLAGAAVADSSWVYFGGPDAKRAYFGNACSQFGAPTAQFHDLTADPIVGTSPSFMLSNASPNSISAPFFGDLDLVGAPLPGGSCLVHLAAIPAPFSPLTIFTDAGGNWVSAPVAMPLTLGTKLVSQAATISAVSPNPIELSNALEITIGW